MSGCPREEITSRLARPNEFDRSDSAFQIDVRTIVGAVMTIGQSLSVLALIISATACWRLLCRRSDRTGYVGGDALPQGSPSGAERIKSV